MDIDYNAVFGLDEIAEEAEESAEVAVGTEADEEIEEGAGVEAQEVAEPEEVDEDAYGTDDDGTEEEADASVSDGKQSAAENAAYAAARRKAEAQRDLAVESAKADAAKEMDSLIKSLGLRDSSGKAITTKAEYDADQAARRQAEIDRQLSRTGLSREALSDVIKAMPEVKAATEAAREMTAARLEAEKIKQKAAFDAEMKFISDSDPTVKSVEDLKAKPYFSDMYEKIKAGYTLSDAYRLATYDDHSRSVADKAAAQAQAKAAGKAHMRPIQSRGSSATSVPAEVLNEYKLFFPTASDAEIARMYSREMNRKK